MASEERLDGLIGFADQLAAGLLKETLQESGGSGDTGEVWSIPCSSECHAPSSAPSPARPEHSSRSAGPQSTVVGSGQLCWTPESSNSLENTMELRRSGMTGEVGPTCSSSGLLRPSVSVPDVGLEELQDRLSYASDQSSNPRLGFLRGWRTKRTKPESGERVSRRKMKSLRKTLSSLFHLRSKIDSSSEVCGAGAGQQTGKRPSSVPSIFKLTSRKSKTVAACQRALPPVPPAEGEVELEGGEEEGGLERELSSLDLRGGGSPDSAPAPADTSAMDFTASIEKVKDRGWYWGPLSGEAAERILSAEPDGSFVVRDSSDHHYIFSLTFKLNGFVRHVRIEHDQGNFSFGSFTRFKSNTIVEFIENAVEHSRSGRYLFFLHRRPVLGPMRVQLLHPVSRFKRVQSLQHLCRYIIVKHVRKDHLDQLPVPNRIKTYLNTPFYYSEQVTEQEEEEDEAGTLEPGQGGLEGGVRDWERELLLQEEGRPSSPVQ